MTNDRLALARWEADRHAAVLEDALQDVIGERLVPATLARLAEPCESWPMRDRLDRLEKLGYVDVEQWLRWREARNRLARAYPDAPALRHAQLLEAIDAARQRVSSRPGQPRPRRLLALGRQTTRGRSA